MAIIPFLSSGKSKLGLRAAAPKTLADLNQNVSRMVDTFIYDYPGLVRDESKPFANVTDDEVRVAIIGSGYTGFTAAYELQRAGIKHLDVFEARQDIGGRVDTRVFRDANDRPYYNEMGPMRVPENSKLFWHYLTAVQPNIDPSKTEVKIFPNPGVVATEMLYQGKRYAWGVGDLPPEPFLTIRNQVFELFIAKGLTYDDPTWGTLDLDTIAGLLVKPTLCDEDQQKIQAYWAHFIEQYDDVSLVEALRQYFDGSSPDRPKWGPSEFNMFSSLGFGTGGFGPLYPVCFLEIFRLLLWSYDQEYQPNISMRAVIQSFAKATGNPQIFETVSYVGLDRATRGAKVNVFTIDPTQPDDKRNRLKKRQYDFVIVATPLRSMQITLNLDGDVAFPPYAQSTSSVFSSHSHPKNDLLRQSIRIPHAMNSSKLFGFLAKKPWIESKEWTWVQGNPVKCVLTDTLARQMYFLDPYEQITDAGSNVLVSYNWGDDSVKIMGIQDFTENQSLDPRGDSNYQLKTAYQNGLATTLPDAPVARTLKQISVANQKETLESIIWQREPMIFGAFKIDYPQQYVYTSQLVFQYHYALAPKGSPCRRVFLANNNCSFQGGWIEGAMQSAVNAASAVLKVLADQGKASDFRMQALFEPNPFATTVGKREARIDAGLRFGRSIQTDGETVCTGDKLS